MREVISMQLGLVLRTCSKRRVRCNDTCRATSLSAIGALSSSLMM